jgi:hypothetical protein
MWARRWTRLLFNSVGAHGFAGLERVQWQACSVQAKLRVQTLAMSVAQPSSQAVIFSIRRRFSRASLINTLCQKAHFKIRRLDLACNRATTHFDLRAIAHACCARHAIDGVRARPCP